MTAPIVESIETQQETTEENSKNIPTHFADDRTPEERETDRGLAAKLRIYSRALFDLAENEIFEDPTVNKQLEIMAADLDRAGENFYVLSN